MNSLPDRFCYSVRLSGRAAARVLENERCGVVTAAFRSTFYVGTNSGPLCVGGEALTPSPLNLMTTAPETTDWPASGVRLGQEVRIADGNMQIGKRFSFRCSDAAQWAPAPLPRDWTAAGLERGLRALRRQARECVPVEGLARLLVCDAPPGGVNALLDAARDPVFGARAWIAVAITSGKNKAGDCAWVRSLAGLGPGLTPSGDDFIGGAMIALRALGEREVCDRIWCETQRQPDIASNPISHAHLSAAAAGEGCAAVHQLLNCVVSGRSSQIADHLAGIARVGHSSGWDTVLGMEAALDGWLRARGH